MIPSLKPIIVIILKQANINIKKAKYRFGELLGKIREMDMKTDFGSSYCGILKMSFKGLVTESLNPHCIHFGQSVWGGFVLCNHLDVKVFQPTVIDVLTCSRGAGL